MVQYRMRDQEMQEMLIEYMGRGFLENIEALFRQEPELGRFIPAMISDGNVGVRLGATALVEDLAERSDILGHAVPGLLGLLADGNPTVRGDAASLLGTIGDVSAKERVEALLKDENAAVREVAKLALEDIGKTKT